MIEEKNLEIQELSEKLQSENEMQDKSEEKQEELSEYISEEKTESLEKKQGLEQLEQKLDDTQETSKESKQIKEEEEQPLPDLEPAKLENINEIYIKNDNEKKEIIKEKICIKDYANYLEWNNNLSEEDKKKFPQLPFDYFKETRKEEHEKFANAELQQEKFKIQQEKINKKIEYLNNEANELDRKHYGAVKIIDNYIDKAGWGSDDIEKASKTETLRHLIIDIEEKPHHNLYELIKNFPKSMEKILALSPKDQIKEYFILKSKLENKNNNNISRAPNPIKLKDNIGNFKSFDEDATPGSEASISKIKEEMYNRKKNL